MLIVLKLHYSLKGGRHAKNPEVIRIAGLIGRKPGAVSRRLGNYASCDPEYTKDGRKGLPHGGPKVMKIWNEFSNNIEKLTEAVDAVLESTYGYEIGEMDLAEARPFDIFPAGLDVERMAMFRLGHTAFSKAVLSAYRDTCCITGINERILLNACHIKPWNVSSIDNERTDPQNGLCLNVLHHCAFDSGLITVGAEDYKVVLSRSLKRNVDNDAYEKFFGIYEDRRITMPIRSPPGKGFLRYHNESVFKH